MKRASMITLIILLIGSLGLNVWFYTERSNLDDAPKLGTAHSTTFNRSVSQGITISDEVVATAEIGANPSQQESIGVTATVSVQCSFKRSVSQDITISDNVTVTVERAND